MLFWKAAGLCFCFMYIGQNMQSSLYFVVSCNLSTFVPHLVITLYMEYPTSQGKLIMPEYGRNIQQMVQYAVTIEDREERTRCVKAILQTMGNLFPYLRDVNDFRHKLWDHLAIMSDFKLDIDFPYEKPQPETFCKKPEPVPYKQSRMHYMHYGRIIEEMIAKAQEFEEGEKKNQFLLAIANQMKKNFLIWNKETVDDRKILQDLYELSDGKINLDAEQLKLLASKDILTKRPNNGGNNNRNNNNQRRNNNNKGKRG